MLACGYLAFPLIDTATALDDARSRADQLEDRTRFSIALVKRSWIDRTSAEVAALADELKSTGAIAKKTEGGYEIDDLIFELRNGVVVDVRPLD